MSVARSLVQWLKVRDRWFEPHSGPICAHMGGPCVA